MKILHIHPSMASGGIESMICALANEMSKTEDVTVCSIFEPVESDSFWHKLSPRVIKTSIGKKTPGFSISVLWRIYRFIRNGKFDVVNLHGMFYYYILSVLFLHKNTRFFYTIHSDAYMENTVWDKRLFALKKFCFTKGLVHPITISTQSQKSFLELYQAKNTLIYNGVPRPCVKEDNIVYRYRLTCNTKVFIHAGRISAPKNQLVLCKVFKRLIDDGHDVALLIVGSKQSNEIYKSIEPYFCDRIVYLGQRNDIPNLMAFSEAMCLPSIWEGLPVTLLESISVGCIPICSDVGGISDVINNRVNGFLSQSPSADDFYKTLQEFLSLSTDEIKIIKQNCAFSFSKYDIRNTSKFYIKLYNSQFLDGDLNHNTNL